MQRLGASTQDCAMKQRCGPGETLSTNAKPAVLSKPILTDCQPTQSLLNKLDDLLRPATAQEQRDPRASPAETSAPQPAAGEAIAEPGPHDAAQPAASQPDAPAAPASSDPSAEPTVAEEDSQPVRLSEGAQPPPDSNAVADQSPEDAQLPTQAETNTSEAPAGPKPDIAAVIEQAEGEPAGSDKPLVAGDESYTGWLRWQAAQSEPHMSGQACDGARVDRYRQAPGLQHLAGRPR